MLGHTAGFAGTVESCMRGLSMFAAFVLLLAIPQLGASAAGLEPLQPWQAQLPTIQKDALQRDVATLEATYAALHPGLHRYLDAAQTDAMYAALRTRFAGPVRLDEAFLAYSAFAARIRCGHTYTNFFNQSETVQKALFQHPRLPFLFRWIDGEMVVTRDLGSGVDLKPGTRIVALDGVRTRAVLDALMPHARADGGNDHKRIAYLQRIGGTRYEAFDIYYPLLYPAAVSDTVRVRFIAPGTRRKQTATARKLPYTAEPPPMQTAAVASDSPLGWSLTYPRSDIAVMRMPDWAAYKHPDFDWQAYVDRAFEAFATRGVRELVVDLRGNEGGDNVGSALLSHMIDAPITPAIPSRSVRYRRVPDALRPSLSTWDQSFYDWGDAARGPENGFYRLIKYDTSEAGIAIAPRAPRFGGRMWVVVGPDNSSATFEFAQAVQLRKLGLLVGEPTGGNQRGINGGAFFFMSLPGSGIELDVPLIAQFPATPMPDAGLLPDLSAPDTAVSIAAGRDVALDAILARIDDRDGSSNRR
jgi:hypothetical protein